MKLRTEATRRFRIPAWSDGALRKYNDLAVSD